MILGFYAIVFPFSPMVIQYVMELYFYYIFDVMRGTNIADVLSHLDFALQGDQSGRSPKVVALFLQQTLVAK